MPVRCEEYNQVCVMSVDGDLTSENAQGMRNASEERITNRQVVDFIVDLEKCGFMVIGEDTYTNPAGVEVEESILRIDAD